MGELLASPVAALVMLVALTAVLIAVGIYVVARVRGGGEETTPSASKLLTKFEDLHSQGGLTDEEYRTIKAMLAEQMQQELSNRDETR